MPEEEIPTPGDVLGPMPAPSTASTASESGTNGEVAPDHAAAEGAPAESSMGSTSTIREMMLSTEPDRPLSAIESPWNPEEGGVTRLYRGLMKATDVDGMPAIVDVIIGAAELMIVLREQQANQEGSDPVDPADALKGV